MHHGKKNIFGRHLFRSHVSGIPILPQVAFVVSRRHAAFSSMCESGLKGYARAFTHELVKITDFPCGAARRHVAVRQACLGKFMHFLTSCLQSFPAAPHSARWRLLALLGPSNFSHCQYFLFSLAKLLASSCDTAQRNCHNLL